MYTINKIKIQVYFKYVYDYFFYSKIIYCL